MQDNDDFKSDCPEVKSAMERKHVKQERLLKKRMADEAWKASRASKRKEETSLPSLALAMAI